MSTNKSLIVLQENSGRVPLPDSLPQTVKNAIYSIVDNIAESFEEFIIRLQAGNAYDTIHLLTDNKCSRKQLLEKLLYETRRNRKIDLVVLGHGSAERLLMKKGPDLTGGRDGTIRDMLKSIPKRYKFKKFNLRMVYMCNCYGSTLNDDWIAIGAKASVGSKMNDYMPEPMTTFFLYDWIHGKKIKKAARNAYRRTIPFYTIIYPPKVKIIYKKKTITYPCPTWSNPLKTCKKKIKVPNGTKLITNSKILETELIVAGNKDLKF